MQYLFKFKNHFTDANLTRIIHRSKGLDKAFFANHRIDPTIGWQYFCNSTGLFRHFPATSWEFHPINMYDCRTRHWFAGAAASSKDILILVERSGSMHGERIAIAIDVVRNILDTLTPNDFVNVLQFNETYEYLLECAPGLIQATSSNIFELKHALTSIVPHGQTDLAEALSDAFDLLDTHKRSSANCNQVIMLITDGMVRGKIYFEIKILICSFLRNIMKRFKQFFATKTGTRTTTFESSLLWLATKSQSAITSRSSWWLARIADTTHKSTLYRRQGNKR